MSAMELRPKLGRWPGLKHGAPFLFVAFFDPSGITTIYESIALWQKFSDFRIDVVNLWPGRGGVLMLPGSVDLNDYAGIIIHCTVSYHPDNVMSLDGNLPRTFERYDGVKILMK